MVLIAFDGGQPVVKSVSFTSPTTKSILVTSFIRYHLPQESYLGHASFISQNILYKSSGKKPAQNSIEIIRHLHICEVPGTRQFNQFKVPVLS